jgi:uncharacterized membrane protein
LINYNQISTLYHKIEKANANIKKPYKAVEEKMKLNKVDEKVVSALKGEDKELTLQELTDKTGEPSKKVFKSLKKLFEHEIIETKARKYSLIVKDVKTVKEKESNL